MELTASGRHGGCTQVPQLLRELKLKRNKENTEESNFDEGGHT
jgi:hypothetical protein